MKNIFVGNLSFNSSEQDIRSLFEAYGTVDRVNIVTDRDSGQPRGFGFVEMANNAEGDKAIAAINGHEVGGRASERQRSVRRRDNGSGGESSRGRRLNREYGCSTKLP